MKYLKFYPIFLLFLALVPAFAFGATEKAGFTRVDTHKIRRIYSMHKKAVRLIERNELRAAVKMYSEILLMEPDDEVAYANMGNCRLILGDFKRAEDAFLNALGINPDNETALLGLKNIHDPDSVEIASDHEEAAWGIRQGIDDKEQENRHPEANAEACLPARQGSHSRDSSSSATDRWRIPQNDVKNDGTLTREEKIQTALKNAGLYTGAIDGQIGPMSRKAVQEFQKQRNLDVDGKVGPKTWAILEKYLEN